MTSLLKSFSDSFWSEEFWLPENRTWKELERTGDQWYPNAWDLVAAIPLAVLIHIIRLFWERYLATPIGMSHNIKVTPPKPPQPNPVLDKVFRQHHKVYPKDHDYVLGLCKQHDMNERQLERWWRRRRLLGKPSEMQRFRETSWRFCYYLFIFWYGLHSLWDKPWMWDTKECWYGHPTQHVTLDIRIYYMLQLSFYCSLVISLYMDNKRKDFWEMVVHHFTTIMLLVFSWSINMVRIGSLVMCVHDAVDFWMEGAKLAKYMKYQRLCDVLFVVFTITWFVTRICVFPMRILKTTLNEGHHILGLFNAYYFFNLLLMALLTLNLIWFYMISQMIYLLIMKGEVEKDDRSETEPEDSTDEDKLNNHTQSTNGVAVAPREQPINNNLTNGKKRR